MQADTVLKEHTQNGLQNAELRQQHVVNEGKDQKQQEDGFQDEEERLKLQQQQRKRLTAEHQDDLTVTNKKSRVKPKSTTKLAADAKKWAVATTALRPTWPSILT
jgi:hypothetical protein